MMEKNDEEHARSKHHLSSSHFVMKALLLVLCVLVVVQFVLVARGFASISDRLSSLEEENSSNKKSENNEKQEASTNKRRSKRNTDEMNIDKTLTKLNKLERRFNQKDRHPMLLARGQGAEGIQGAKGYPELRAPRGYTTNVAVVYIRWGKKTCPNTGAKLVYRGYVGGSHYTQRGGGSNYVCLTRDPIYARYQSGYQSNRAKMYGAEYQIKSAGIYHSSLHQHDVPCAVCHVVRRASQIMIPGRNECPAGWTREYKGYLMAERYGHHRTMFTCVDEYPDYTRGTHQNVNGVLFYFVEGRCGSLPCKPYIGGRELTCAVCTR